MKKKSLFLMLFTVILLCCTLVFTACRDNAQGDEGDLPSGGQETSGVGSEPSSGTGTGSIPPGETDTKDPAGSESGTDISGEETTDPSHVCQGDAWVIVKAATCTEEGEEQRKCECGKVLETRAIAKADHNLTSYEGLAATCTGDGWKPYKACGICDYNTYEKIVALDHDEEMHTAKAPTCIDVGNPAYKTCKRTGCDYTTYVELPTVKHSYGTDTLCIWCQKEYGGQPLAYVSNGNGTCTLTGIGDYTGTEVEVPFEAMNGETVVAVKEGAFSGKPIKSLTFSENSAVTKIGKGAFENCPSLETVTLPVSLESIGESAFSGCARLWSVTVPTDGALTTIGRAAFKNCVFLASFTLPAGVESIGEIAFYECRRLVEVYDLSTHLTVRAGADSVNGSIGYRALAVKTDGNAASCVWMSGDGFLFYENGNACYLLGGRAVGIELSLPATCNGKNYAIHAYAFYGSDALEKVTFPAAVTEVGDYAFGNCKQLSLADAPADGALERIGEGAFLNCGMLTSFTLPESLTAIGNNAFLKCYRLVMVYDLSDTIKVEEKNATDHGGVGAYAIVVFTDDTVSVEERISQDANGYLFYAQTHTRYLIGYRGTSRNLSLPQSYEGLEYAVYRYAFYGESGIESVTFSEKVTGIGEYAFGECVSLEKVVISKSVDRIDANAFSGCQALSEAEFKLVKIWKCINEPGDISGINVLSSKLESLTEAATLLRSTYASKYWVRIDPDPDWSGWY